MILASARVSGQPHRGVVDTASMSTTTAPTGASNPRGTWLLAIGLALVALSIFGHGWGTESDGRWLGLREGVKANGTRYAYDPSADARGFVDAASFAFWIGIGAVACGLVALGVALGGGARRERVWPAQLCCWMTGVYGLAAFAVASELAKFGRVTGVSLPCAVFGGLFTLVGCHAVTSPRQRSAPQ